MSSLGKSYDAPPRRQRLFDSGVGSNLQSGSFGEGYLPGLDHPGLDDEYYVDGLLGREYGEPDLAYSSLDGHGPLSLQPASSQPLSLQNTAESNDSAENKSHFDSSSSTASTNGASGVDTTLDANCSDTTYGNGEESTCVATAIPNENEAHENEPDMNEPSQDGPPSPVLSNVRAQCILETIIRSSVVKSRPEVISERVLVERGCSNSLTSNNDTTTS